jgi:6-phosphogluconolactonase/glucosamine-6-phosphate isomerase/deaminase
MPASSQSVFSFPNDEALSAAAAQDWLTLLQNSSGAYTVALSGGRIAKTFFAAVAGLAKASGANFTNVHFFWADELSGPTSVASGRRTRKVIIAWPGRIC